MKCIYIVLLLFLIFHVGTTEKFVAVLVNHNTNVDTKIDQSKENIRYNIDNILRAAKCKKKGMKCSKGFNSKIVGGFEVRDITKFPYHAQYGSTCGAAIIGEKWLLTAAHCGKKPFVTVGSIHLTKGRMYFIEHFFLHPGWDADNKTHFFDYDYQIVELFNEIKFSNTVKPIKIGTRDDLKAGTVVTVTGWGHTTQNGKISQILNAVEVPVVSLNQCQKVKFPMFRKTLTSRMFCAGYFEGGKDACQGDSGGAAVANGRLVGLVSFGYGCATPEAYGVYADVVTVKSWIESKINDV